MAFGACRRGDVLGSNSGLAAGLLRLLVLGQVDGWLGDRRAALHLRERSLSRLSVLADSLDLSKGWCARLLKNLTSQFPVNERVGELVGDMILLGHVLELGQAGELDDAHEQVAEGLARLLLHLPEGLTSLEDRVCGAELCLELLEHKLGVVRVHDVKVPL